MKRKNISNTTDGNISVELVKEIITDIFREQEKKLLDLVRNGISDTSVGMDRLTQEISDDNIKLNALSKKRDDLKLSLETSQEITDNNLRK